MWVVPALDPFERGHPGLGLASEAPSIEQLTLKRCEFPMSPTHRSYENYEFE
jgi:hypothetical protein